MTLSRRKFLSAGSVAAFFSGAFLNTTAPVFGRPITREGARLDTLSRLTRESFSKHLNTTFRVSTHPLIEVELRLIEAMDLRPSSGGRAAGAGKECFSVIFQGPDSAPLKQETYKINHDALGELTMLLVPVDRSKERRLYQAIVNQL